MRILLFLLLQLFLVSCARPGLTPPAPGLERFDMFQGQMISMKDGTELRFEIGGPHWWENEVLVRAKNHINGESFSGRFILLGNGNASTSIITNAWGLKAGEVQTSSDGKNKIAKGIIKGDKGTIINLTLETRRVDEKRPGGGNPWYYHGFGEGTDNHDNRYTIQFPGNSHSYWHKNSHDLLNSTSSDLIDHTATQ
jgi:hypothetical protein